MQDKHPSSEVVTPRWYTIEQVAIMLNYGLTKTKYLDTGLVFTTRHGTALEPRNFSRSFDRCVVKAQVPRITVHGTRKTCGSLLAALDVHPRVAMQILRHSKIAVTMEIYTEVPSAATRDALKKLGQWLGS